MNDSTEGDSRQRASDETRTNFADAEACSLDDIEAELWGEDVPAPRSALQAIYEEQESSLDFTPACVRDPKARWEQTLAALAFWTEEAAQADLLLPFNPDDPALRRRHLIATSQMKRLQEQVDRGRRTYDETYKRWHGHTREEGRAMEREGYARKIMEEEGRAVRPYVRLGALTAEQRAVHKKQKAREKKARWRQAQK